MCPGSSAYKSMFLAFGLPYHKLYQSNQSSICVPGTPHAKVCFWLSVCHNLYHRRVFRVLISPRDRHTRCALAFASHLVMQGVGLPIVMRLVGHSFIQAAARRDH